MTSPEVVETFLGGAVRTAVGDLTRLSVDAIVNAANSTLLGGGGVDGAIHAAGGPSIVQECRKIRKTSHPDGLPTGHAVMTNAGDLPARHVIHTVGPVYNEHDLDSAKVLLADCYRSTVALADEHALQSIAFPAISTGAFGFPREQAAVVVSTTLELSLQNRSNPLMIWLVFFSPADATTFHRHQQFSF